MSPVKIETAKTFFKIITLSLRHYIYTIRHIDILDTFNSRKKLYPENIENDSRVSGNKTA